MAINNILGGDFISKAAKIKKIALIIIIGTAILIFGVFAWYSGLYKLLFVNQIYYGVNTASMRVIADETNEDELNDKGYFINYPIFEGSSSLNCEKFIAVYTEFQSVGSMYARDIANTYENYAKLDFEVEAVKGKTLTIGFFGYGYPDKGNGEPIMLDKEFVFDISDVSADNLPVLLNN